MPIYIARAYPRASIKSVPVTQRSTLKPVRVEALNDAYALKKAWKLLRRLNPSMRGTKRARWTILIHDLRMLNQIRKPVTFLPVTANVSVAEAP